MNVVKAAAVQLSPVLYSREGTVDKIVRKIHELGQQGVQFATFPETVLPYYPYFSFLQRLIDRTPRAHVHERDSRQRSGAERGTEQRVTTVL
jgi:predicted amidohydrolase